MESLRGGTIVGGARCALLVMMWHTLLALVALPLGDWRGANLLADLLQHHYLLAPWTLVPDLIFALANLEQHVDPLRQARLGTIVLGTTFACALIVFIIGYRGFRFGLFFRLLWRAHASATLITMILLIGIFDTHEWGSIFLVITPAALGSGFLACEVRRRERLCTWRPTCPDCGFSIRRAGGANCTECGAPHVGDVRRTRRWAVSRLPWERGVRPFLPFALVQTLFLVILCPCRAGSRIAVPDRWTRALCWAGGALLITALVWTVGIVLIDDVLGTRPTFRQRPPSGIELVRSDGLAISWTVYARWTLYRMFAWIGAAVLLLGPILVLLPFLRCAPAARWTLLKWSFYALLACNVGTLLALLSLLGGAGSNREPLREAFVALYDNTDAWNLLGSVTTFSIWWSAGAAFNRYLPQRGWATFVQLLGRYWLLFALLYWVLFRPSVLIWSL